MDWHSHASKSACVTLRCRNQAVTSQARIFQKTEILESRLNHWAAKWKARVGMAKTGFEPASTHLSAVLYVELLHHLPYRAMVIGTCTVLSNKRVTLSDSDSVTGYSHGSAHRKGTGQQTPFTVTQRPPFCHMRTPLIKLPYKGPPLYSSQVKPPHYELSLSNAWHKSHTP